MSGDELRDQWNPGERDSYAELEAENKRLREDQRRLEWLMLQWPIKMTRDTIDTAMKESGDG